MSDYAGFSPFCARTPRVDVLADCRQRPVALISCESKVVYNYNSHSFPAVTMVGHGSFEFANLSLGYQWTWVSLPAGATG